jgi:pyruvate/2-oxoglutarate/acetoin dehydrogenase E1 component
MHKEELVPERICEYREALNQALLEEMERDPSVFIMGEDVGRYGGVLKVSKGIYERFGPMRAIDTPISENGFTSIGVGAALAGLRPVVELMYIDFACLAMDPIVNQAAKARYMFGGKAKFPLYFAPKAAVGAVMPLSTHKVWKLGLHTYPV